MLNIFLSFQFMLKIGITLIKYIRHHSCNPISMQIVVIFSSILPFSKSRKFLLLHMRSRDFPRYAMICTGYWKAELRSWNTIKPVRQNTDSGDGHSNSFKPHVSAETGYTSWIFKGCLPRLWQRTKILGKCVICSSSWVLPTQ